MHITVASAYGSLVGTVPVDLIVPEAVVDGERIGQHGQVAVIIVGKSHIGGIRPVDCRYPACRIVLVSSYAILRIVC